MLGHYLVLDLGDIYRIIEVVDFKNSYVPFSGRLLLIRATSDYTAIIDFEKCKDVVEYSSLSFFTEKGKVVDLGTDKEIVELLYT